MNPSSSSYRAQSHRNRRPRHSSSRRLLLLLVIAAALAIGMALGAAIEQGSGAQGTQTREQTIQVVTVTVPQP